MGIFFNSPVTCNELMSILSYMSDRDLSDEYTSLQACYKALDDVFEGRDFCDSIILSYMDFLEHYMFQEICRRFCALHSDVPVLTYWDASDVSGSVTEGDSRGPSGAEADTPEVSA